MLRLALLLLGLTISAAHAQSVNGGGSGGSVAVDNQTIVSKSGVISTSASDRTTTTSATILATDMGGQVNFNGSNLTLTIPAISSTVLAANMSVTVCNYNVTPVTISSTPGINGYSIANGIPGIAGGTATCLNMTSNGTTLDVNATTNAQPPAFALTDGATVALDCSKATVYTWAPAASGHTLSNPTNCSTNQWFTVLVTQPAAGGPYTIAFGTAYKDAGNNALAVTLNTAASSTTAFSCQVIAATPTLLCFGAKQSATGVKSVAAPTAPASTSAYQAQGLSSGATVFTPATTGNVQCTISGHLISTVTAAGDGLLWYVMYGTGNGNANGSTTLGTQAGSVQEYMIPATVTAADVFVPFSKTVILTGLTVGTGYYVDLAAKAVVATGIAFQNVDVMCGEIR